MTLGLKSKIKLAQNVDIIRAMESIQEGTETLGACSLGYYVLQKQKSWSEKKVQKEKGNVQIKCCV